MSTTFTDTYNRDDIRRVHASFAADYTIVAEWTGLRSPADVASNIAGIKSLAEAQYLKEVHIQLVSASGAIRQAAVYRVSTNASGWSTDRPGDLYWDNQGGDSLRLVVFYNASWAALSKAEQHAFRELHLPGWGPSDFEGDYGAMSSVADRHYASRSYGLERTRYSS